jgi:integrase
VRCIKPPLPAAGRRTVPIVPQLVPILANRIISLARAGLLTPATPLLATRYATPMTHNQLWRVVKRVAARAGVRVIACTCNSRRVTLHGRGCPRTVSGDNRSGVTPHTLRRTFGSDLLNKGLRLEVVSKLLGHANTTITERAYAHLLGFTIRSELLEALGQLSPIAHAVSLDRAAPLREPRTPARAYQQQVAELAANDESMRALARERAS